MRCTYCGVSFKDLITCPKCGTKAIPMHPLSPASQAPKPVPRRKIQDTEFMARLIASFPGLVMIEGQPEQEVNGADIVQWITEDINNTDDPVITCTALHGFPHDDEDPSDPDYVRCAVCNGIVYRKE